MTGGLAVSDAYHKFLANKAMIDPMTGISNPPELIDALFPFQRDIVNWALRRGRAAIFAGTGLGKSLMEIAWADAVTRATGKRILHLAPLAVSNQMVREAGKFGFNVKLVASQSDCDDGTNITNYQKLDHFDVSQFGGVILDESSILKSRDGHYAMKMIGEFQSIPFRLAATATPSPNDFTELGNHAEFLGVMKYTDMLATFFVHDGGSTQNWRLKGHAENEFWKWMAQWSVMLRKPSDLGYDNTGYDLPPLNYHNHIVESTVVPDGFLFAQDAQTLSERITARRDSVEERCNMAAEITPSEGHFVWWCNLNSESEMIKKLIPGAVEVRGSDDDTSKERKLVDFSEGKIRVLVTKPSICGFGMNWQHCHNTGFVGLNDSFEQYYQAVRRFWRFGQTEPVNCHIISASNEGATLANIRRKEADADRMSAAMAMHTSALSSAAIKGQVRDVADYNPQQDIKIPSFLGI
jgi:hypothetical protein